MKRITVFLLVIAAALIGLPISGSDSGTSLSTNSACAIELTEYVVSSYGGYGLYLRSSPRNGAKTNTVYRDGTHFLGRYSGTPGWISVVVNNRVIGYLPAEKVYVVN